MELLDVIEIGQKKIELLEGDLTEIPEERAVDLLVLSAFPDDYMPTRTSLIGALERKGLSVEALSALKEEDLRDSFACWLTEEFACRCCGQGQSARQTGASMSLHYPPGHIRKAVVADE